MKIRLFSILGLFLLIQKLSAASIQISDTAGRRLHPKERAFLEEQGTDELSKAVIRKFFSIRRQYKIAVSGMAAATVIAGVGVINEKNKSGSSLAGLVLWDVALFFTGLAFLLSFGAFLFHSKRRLLKMLENYRATGNLPRKYRELTSY